MRKVTRDSLERSALYYLERFASTRAQLTRVLQRKVLQVARLKPVPPEAAEWVTQVVERMVAHGYVDDARYARSKVSALGRRGQSGRAVAQALKMKGVAPPLVAEALQAHDDEAAAWSYARRRKLGPYATPEARKARRAAHLAALVRRGFGFSLAKRVIDAPTPLEE